MGIFEKLGPQHLDLFKEIGNIGAGNTATSLSMMMNSKVEISVPSAKVIPIAKIPMLFEDPEEIVAGVRMGIEGDMEGYLLFVIDSAGAKKILKKLLGTSPEDMTELDPMSTSALSEIGNIVCGSYLMAFSGFTGMSVNGKVPELIVDMITAIISETSISVMSEEDYILIVETDIIIEGEEKIRGFLMFLPEPEALLKVISKMGMGIEDGE
ncbi:MAG: chemotaxis protein CheC [Thermotoga sp.]|nr:MAG: chemotaxis protein CheC [Thermotoga sp.]